MIGEGIVMKWCAIKETGRTACKLQMRLLAFLLL